MASMKENELLKGDIMSTKHKLTSIENNSFGSNDMVVALKKEIESTEADKQELLEKIESLESQLETATEDALELNKMVSELLNNQTGSETILSTVEELQRQLNEQQETITTVNETLAIKSRENSELLMQLASIEEKQDEELRVCRQGADAIALERNNLLIELENLKHETDVQVNQLVEERNSEVTRLNNELTNYIKKYEESNKNFISAESKAQALEECLNSVKKGGEFKEIFDVADLKADLLAVTKEKSTIQELLQNEKDARKLLEDRVKAVSEEMSNLKIEFGVAEKEKLEAQTRLEVLSTYFKDKETQLQKELSLKEALWMKSQGETTNTVEKIQALNDEVQQLK
jgi:transport and golgi organization protein 1